MEMKELDLSSHRHSYLEWLAQGNDPFRVEESLERLGLEDLEPVGAFEKQPGTSIAEDPHFAENFGDLRGDDFKLYLKGMWTLAVKLSHPL